MLKAAQVGIDSTTYVSTWELFNIEDHIVENKQWWSAHVNKIGKLSTEVWQRKPMGWRDIGHNLGSVGDVDVIFLWLEKVIDLLHWQKKKTKNKGYCFTFIRLTETRIN